MQITPAAISTSMRSLGVFFACLLDYFNGTLEGNVNLKYIGMMCIAASAVVNALSAEDKKKKKE